ncbi:MAG: TerC family protein, partial [Thermoguttaceae bacterium]
PLEQQHRILFWGVLGALVLRGAMIAIGTVLLGQFEWTVYVFAILLILLAVKMLRSRHDNVQPVRNLAVRQVHRLYRVSDRYEGNRFFTVQGGRAAITPLMLALLVVETSDLMLAADSILASFAVTRDPFLVFASNVFAVLGMRSLYFALAPRIAKLRYLRMGLVFLLICMSVKMILSHHKLLRDDVSVAVIGVILLAGATASLLVRAKPAGQAASPLVDDVEALANTAYRQARRVVILVVGSTVILVGVVMLVTPGPAMLVIPIGLAILGIEFAWARRWLKRMGQAVKDVHGQFMKPRSGR